MRVLWFTNTAGCYNPSGAGGGGGWISSAEIAMRQRNDIQLGISFIMNGQPKCVKKGNVVYYPMPWPWTSYASKIRRFFSGFKRNGKQSEWATLLNPMHEVIDDFHPDIIHIFGSERHFGLIASEVEIPVILHIQGLLIPYLTAFLIPGVSKMSYYLQDYSVKKIFNRYFILKSFQRDAEREKEIFTRVNYFLGRTEWDKRLCKVLNPKANYFYGSEILREEFYDISLKEKRNKTHHKFVIISTLSGPLYKGLDLVLKTAYVLKCFLKLDFEWKLFGQVDFKMTEKLTGIDHSNVNISVCGIASAQTLHDELIDSDVYFQPSYIDNSPNSVCEAQILAVPVIVTHVGGTYSLIEDGVTGYSVPSNDPWQAAFLINKLAMEPQFASKMGMAARDVALKRHDRDNIISDLVDAYSMVIKSYKKNNHS